MREGPDLAHIASLVGDPARANMLTALMSGTALTASELALEAGVGLPTASSHLAKLTAGGLLKLSVQGRHRYFALAGPHIAAMLEAIMGVAATVGPQRVRPGPRDRAMREARVCYDHLAGDLAVAMLDRLLAEDVIVQAGRRGHASAAKRQSFFARARHRHDGTVRPAAARLPHLPRLERAALASRRLAGRGHPRQSVRGEMGAARERRPGRGLLAQGQAGLRAGVSGRSRSCAAGFQTPDDGVKRRRPPPLRREVAAQRRVGTNARPLH